MNTQASLALIAIGVVLGVHGTHGLDSLGPGLSRMFTGAPSDQTLRLLVAGGVALAIGVAGFLHGPGFR